MLALGGVNLTGAAGRLTMQVLAAVAEFEQDLLIERTQSGLTRATAAGKTLGCRPMLSAAKRTMVAKRLAGGETISAISRALGTSRQTILLTRDARADMPT